jgi:predicted nuclease of restriction endonuclease-like RecB superfamily
MLTREHAIADVDFQRGRLLPDRLTRRRHGQYADHAARMLAVYRGGVGQMRRELHRRVAAVLAEEADCPARRVEAFCKLLDDVATYDTDRRGRAATLRRQVFHQAAAMHPLLTKAERLFEHEEATVKAQIAAELGRPWSEIEAELFADVIECQRMTAFAGYDDAQALLSRYNVAQVQAALFDATSMTVWSSQDFKLILRYARLAGLMHVITRQGDGAYCFRFDGPASALRQTRRYGVAMARFLPSLLACRGWRMHAALHTRRGWNLSLDLSSEDGLRGRLPAPGEFDSRVEESFHQRWGDEPREGWTLIREGEVLHRDQKVFVPDFVLRHADGRQALLEIVGYWTPEYLKAKIETLRAFHEQRILLAVGPALAGSLTAPADLVVHYKTRLKIDDVLARLRDWT